MGAAVIIQTDERKYVTSPLPNEDELDAFGMRIV